MINLIKWFFMKVKEEGISPITKIKLITVQKKNDILKYRINPITEKKSNLKNHKNKINHSSEKR